MLALVFGVGSVVCCRTPKAREAFARFRRGHRGALKPARGSPRFWKARDDHGRRLPPSRTGTAAGDGRRERSPSTPNRTGVAHSPHGMSTLCEPKCCIPMEEPAGVLGLVAPDLAIEEAPCVRREVSLRRLLAPWPHPEPNQGTPWLFGQGDSGVPEAAEARHRGEAAKDGCIGPATLAQAIFT